MLNSLAKSVKKCHKVSIFANTQFVVFLSFSSNLLIACFLSFVIFKIDSTYRFENDNCHRSLIPLCFIRDDKEACVKVGIFRVFDTPENSLN